jgi:glucokinase
MELLRVLQTRFGRVSCERVCSGPGLLNLAWAMAMLQGRTSPWQTPADLVADAERGDGLAQACMQVFCQWFGSVAGDLAMVLQARTVCLAGGVTGHVRKFLAAGGFMRRFVDKGVLEEALRAVPVLMLEHGELGLIGAGAWYAQVIATPEA